FLFVGWGAFFIYVVFRYRSGANPKASYEGAKGKISKGLEIGVVIAEMVLLVFYAIPAWAKRVKQFPPENEATVVRVIAEQFAWNIQYPGPDRRVRHRVLAALRSRSLPHARVPQHSERRRLPEVDGRRAQGAAARPVAEACFARGRPPPVGAEQARPLQCKLLSDIALDRAPIGQIGRRHIFYGHPERLEDRYLGIAAAAGRAVDELANLGDDVLRAESPFLNAKHDVS